jgi:hypothetical protein
VAHDPRSTHPMVTRHGAGVTKPVDRLQLSTTAAPPTLSPVLTSVRSVLTDPHCRHAMEEYEALLSNNTWDLVPQPPGDNVVTDKWIFKHKLKVDGSLNRYKARWVLRMFTQRPGDEDIPTHDDSPVAIQRPITKACACQLQYQVKSFLSSTPCQLQDRLLPNEILIVRNEGEAYEGLKNQLGGGQGRGQGARQ